MSKHYQEYRDIAHKELEIALELIEATYQLSLDPKVLVSALHHLKKAQDACISFVMYLENKALDVELFIQLAKKNNSLSKDEETSVLDVHRLYREQKESDVEFRRKESYVLCNKNYELSTLTLAQLQKYLKHTIALTKKILR